MRRALFFAVAPWVVLLSACQDKAVSPTQAPSEAAILEIQSSSSATLGPPTSPPPSVALHTLERLTIKGRAPHTGYKRAQFGSSWADVDHNGCDTRNDILNRDLTDRTWRDSRHCVVLTGALQDPYTGKHLAFQKEHSARVQIDHVLSAPSTFGSA